MNIKRTNKLKTNNYGFGHMEIILVVLVVAIIGVVGFTVFNNHKTSSSLKATARVPGYTKLSGAWNTNQITVSACKTYTNIWGGIYTVKLLFTKAASTPAFQYVAYDDSSNSGRSQSTTSTAYYAGTVAAVTINMSVVNRDIVHAQTNEGLIYQYMIVPDASSLRGANVKSINRITTCK